ncbi:hypothetical protein BKA81DRAFT_363802 [Phyllosticta paracitricarpa]
MVITASENVTCSLSSNITMYPSTVTTTPRHSALPSFLRRLTTPCLTCHPEALGGILPCPDQQQQQRGKAERRKTGKAET